MGQVELPVQVVGETFRGGGAAGEVVVLAAAGGGQGRGVDLVPAGVDRKIGRDVVLPFRIGLGGAVPVLVRRGVLRRGGRLVTGSFGAGVRSLGGRLVGIAAVVDGLVVHAFLDHLQHGIGLDGLLDLLLHFQRRKLQQADGLLQLGGHGQGLPDPELERRFHASIILSAIRWAQSARCLHGEIGGRVDGNRRSGRNASLQAESLSKAGIPL
jgi:hypothetical protein